MAELYRIIKQVKRQVICVKQPKITIEIKQ